MAEHDMLPQCQRMIDDIRKDVIELDKIVRGTNGEGLTTKIRVVQNKLDAIYKLAWFITLAVIGIGIERVFELLSR